MNTIKKARHILETSLNAINCTTKDLEFYEAKELTQTIKDWLESDPENDNLDLDDLPCGEVLIVHNKNLLVTLTERQESDPYVLGCTHSHVLAEVTGWPEVLITAAQQGEAYDSLGQAIIDEGYSEDLAQWIIDKGAAGESLSGYDGQEHESLNGDFLIYRTN